MKKAVSVLLCLCLAVCAFTACSKTIEKTGNESTVAETQNAVIANEDAINLITSYSDDELGLTEDERKECTFMVAKSGVQLKKKNYIKVVAAVKTEHNENDSKSFTFDNKGEYYIRYDGKEVLSLDMESNELKKMKVKDVPTTQASADDHTHADDTSHSDEKQSTTKK